MRQIKVITLLVVLGCLLGGGFWAFHENEKEVTPAKVVSTSRKQSVAQPASFNKTQYSTDTPGSLWWIVNKKRPLPEGYAPTDLVTPGVTLRLAASSDQMRISNRATDSVTSLFTAANQVGFPLVFASGYRSIAYQTQLYNGYVQSSGQAAADRYSAKPGTSEHQTGLAFDLCSAGTGCALEQSFGDTPAGKWVAAHAHEYGFVVRYAKDKENITGYEYEPWHLRYVGKDLATELFTTQQTMEEFFGIN